MGGRGHLLVFGEPEVEATTKCFNIDYSFFGQYISFGIYLSRCQEFVALCLD